MHGTSASMRSPFLTPGREQSAFPVITPSPVLRGSNGSKRIDEYMLGGSVLDQLHAEQKSTIEALTCQVEFYRKREDRYKKELDTLRAYLAQSDKDTKHVELITKLTTENRLLGEEIDGLRQQQATSAYDKTDLEGQLEEARASLTGFSQAIEQLELKMQRKEAEVQTRCLELEQDLRMKTQECESLKVELQRVNDDLQNLQSVNLENQRLRNELQTNSAQNAEKESTATQLSAQLHDLQRQLEDVQASKRQQDTLVLELEQNVAQALHEKAEATLQVEKCKNEIKELQLQLANSSNLLDLREKLLSSDDSRRQQTETQRQELMALVASLQREKEQLEHNVASMQQKVQAMELELKTAKNRLSMKDNSVIVTTLKNEILSLKERIRREIKMENDGLRSEKDALVREISTLQTRMHEKESFIRRLQDEILGHEEKQKQQSYEMMRLRDQISSLEAALATAHAQYQQLQDCRSALADKLDHGFKELLSDDVSAESAVKEAEALRRDVQTYQMRIASLEAQVQTLQDDCARAQTQVKEMTQRMNAKLEELYQELQLKDDAMMQFREMELTLKLLEHEKATWQQQTADSERLHDQRLRLEQKKAEDLKHKIDQLETTQRDLQTQILTLHTEKQDQAQQTKAAVDQVTAKDLELQAAKHEHAQLQAEISRLEGELQDAKTNVADGLTEKSARERKLLSERKQLEKDIKKLVARIEMASTRNTELGDKVIVLMKQAKKDQSEIVALETQLKAYRQKTRELEDQVRKTSGKWTQQADAVDDLKRQLCEVTCLKESYQLELTKLRESMQRTKNEQQVAVRQKDEAMKRIKMLMKCQEQMKTTVERHTTELVEEIETTQQLLENERKRSAMLLANEKVLVRDLQERNGSIAKLQQALVLAQRQEQQHTDTTIPTPMKSIVTHNGVSLATPAKELDKLLSNLEKISEYSSQQERIPHNN